MKVKWKKIILVIVLWIFSFFIGGFIGKTIVKEKYENATSPTLRVSEDEFIDKIQVLTVNSGGELIYQFCGEMDINISDDGTEIIFNTPCVKDCCFDNGGENE